METAIGVVGDIGLSVMGPQRMAMILDPITLLFASSAGLLFWLIRRHRKNRREAILSIAWHEVLQDPHYAERRRVEERRLFTQEAHNHGRG